MVSSLFFVTNELCADLMEHFTLRLRYITRYNSAAAVSSLPFSKDTSCNFFMTTFSNAHFTAPVCQMSVKMWNTTFCFNLWQHIISSIEMLLSAKTYSMQFQAQNLDCEKSNLLQTELAGGYFIWHETEREKKREREGIYLENTHRSLVDLTLPPWSNTSVVRVASQTTCQSQTFPVACPQRGTKKWKERVCTGRPRGRMWTQEHSVCFLWKAAIILIKS